MKLLVILAMLLFSSTGLCQADLDHTNFVNDITKIIDNIRGIYETGFNDGLECLTMLHLKYKYGDYTEQPTSAEMVNECRSLWNVEAPR